MKKRFYFVLLTSFILLSTTIVNAVPLTVYKLPSTTSYYYYDNWLSSNSRVAASNGASKWTNAVCDVNYYYSSGGYITYVSETSKPSVEWDGITNTTYYSSTGIVVSETITFNTAKTQTYNSTNGLLSVAAHEFGHVLGLGDDGTNATLMNGYTWGTNSRYGGYGITGPTSSDLSAANSKY